MKIDILTLFPDMFAPLKESIIKRAVDKKLTTRHPRVLTHSVKQVQSTIENMPAGKIEQRGYLELEEPRAPARAME